MTKKSILLGIVSTVFLAACNNPMMTPTPTPERSDTMMEDTTMPANDTVFNLTEQNASGQTGTMTLAETTDGKVMVTLNLTGGTFAQPQPAHIHEGHCPTPGAVKYPLTDVVNGQSTTTLDVDMATMLASAPELAVNIHKSAAEAKVYTACADIQ